MVSPVCPGTFSEDESYSLSKSVYICPEQEIAQIEFLLSWPNRLKKFSRDFLLFSMLARSDEEHSFKVLPAVPSVTQVISVPLQINQESYCELTNNSRTLREVQAYSRERHLYSSPTLKRLQVLKGVFSSTFETRQRFWACVSNFISPDTVGKFMKTLESDTTDKPIGLASSPLTQVDHNQAAVPPMDDPVSSTFSAEGRSQLVVSHFRCERVISEPRKQSSASLQRQACLVPLEWKAPSQQLMTTFVHEANLLVAGSVERYPCPSYVSGRFLLDPKSVLLRLQQLSSTQDRLLPMQQPPPTKQMRNLFFSVPWWKYTAGDEPSRHLALASVLWMTFLQSQAVWARLSTSNSTVILIKILLIDRLQTSSQVLLPTGCLERKLVRPKNDPQGANPASLFIIRSVMDQVDRYSFRQFLVPAQPIPYNLSRLRTLNDAVLQALGDTSQPERNRSLLQIVVDLYGKLGIKLRPGCVGLLIWQLIVMCVIIFYVLELGLLLAFTEAFWQDDLNGFVAIHVIFIFIIVADMLISPLKCYYEEGLLIKDLSLIFRKYLKVDLWIDLLGLISVVVPLATGSLFLNLLKVVWLAKIRTASRINVQFQRVTQLYITLNTTYLVVKLIVFGFIYAHYMGLFFYMVSLWVYQNNYYGPNTPNLCWVYNSWAFYQMALILSWQQMYAYIMYYSIAVVTTIAYGDITPKNPIQCIYTIFALIAVTILWGYIMTEILRVMIAVFTYQFDRRFTHFQLVSKLKAENIQQEVQVQVRAHTNEIDREEQYRNRHIQEQIMNFLPSEPLYGLLLLIYHAFLDEMGFRFFSLCNLSMHSINCRSPFLEAFMKDVREERHYTGDLLYAEGQSHSQTPEGHSVYYFTKTAYANTVMLGVGAQPIVKDGKVEKKGRSFELSKANTIFGQTQFLNGMERSHWAFCLANCVMLVASRHSLLKHYHLLSLQQKEKVLMRMETAAESNCLVCHQDHAFLHCPYTFFNAKDILHEHRQAPRKSSLIRQSRTRIKTKSSWTIFQSIRGLRMQVSKEYRQRLLQDRRNHSLFIQYELQEDNHDHDDEQFNSKLHEAEVMVDRLYLQLMRQMGRCTEAMEYDCVHDYQHYKPHNNIKTIIREIANQYPSRRQANLNAALHSQ